ncbi:MAG: hypothetical protein IPO27_08115 [Bacteroidetes bacterium]|nr:hypothetical protein [Bacteroidota bacterium]
MKKTLTVFLVLLLIFFFKNDKLIAQHSCNYCDASFRLGDPNPHYITDAVLVEYIKAFRAKFSKATFYGGTIYGDYDYFYNLALADYKVIKFHFCSLGDDSRKLFLAFEGGQCTSGVLDLSVHDCLISCDEMFGHLAINPPENYLSRLESHTIPPAFSIPPTAEDDYSCQQLPDSNVTRYKKNLTNNEYYNADFGCADFVGCFNFDATIATIFSTYPKCKGIRYYFGYDSKITRGSKIRVILVGVDANGKNIRNSWKENSRPN